MKILTLLLIAVTFYSCNKAKQDSFENYSLNISDEYYTYDLKSGIYKIEFLNFSDTISLNEDQQNEIGKLFFKFSIDTLNGTNNIYNKRTLMMPDFGDVIKVKKNSSEKASLYISGQLINNKEVREVEMDIINFKYNLFKILNKNIGYRNCMDTLRKNYKKLPPLM